MKRLALLLTLVSGAARAERHIGVDDAIRMALAANPQFRAGVARVSGVGDLASSARGRLLPNVRVSDEYQHWNGPFALPFGPTTFQLRDADTNSFSATVGQPLLGLIRLSQDYLGARSSADAAQAGLQAAEAQLREAVRAGFLRYFEARALEQIAASSVAELGEQVRVAEARVKAGVATNADLLRVQVAQSNARQQQIVAHTQADTTRALVLRAIGLEPNDATIELDEPRQLLDEAQRPLPALADATAAAEARRPEVHEAQFTLRAAEHHRRASTLALLPEVDLEGGYLRVDGQKFAPANSEFIGVRAQWNAWDWGATYYAARSAREAANAAAFELEDRRRGVATEVHNRLAETQAAASAVEVARTAIASAEEAYRVTTALVNAGSATTTDLLNSQAELTTARLNLTRAQYERAIARVALARAAAE
jgi:outer membrane protein